MKIKFPQIPILLVLSLLFFVNCVGQPNLEKTLKRLNKESVPYIQAVDLRQSEATRLDSRNYEEYAVSHLPDALWVGYKEFSLDSILKKLPAKDKPVVVYCSIGVRSERIAEQLQEAGYTEVYNLYGGIFEWKNKGYPVMDLAGRPTEKVHPYSRYWGRFLTKADKVYTPD